MSKQIDSENKNKKQCDIHVVSKSFAVGKKVKIIGCEKGHRFMTDEIVELVEKELNMWWAKNNIGDEWLINENEVNVC